MKQAFVKPKAGLRVAYPDRPREQLPPDGAIVNLDAYWRNRIRDGDVALAKPEPKPQPTKKAKDA